MYNQHVTSTHWLTQTLYVVTSTIAIYTYNVHFYFLLYVLGYIISTSDIQPSAAISNQSPQLQVSFFLNIIIFAYGLL